MMDFKKLTTNPLTKAAALPLSPHKAGAIRTGIWLAIVCCIIVLSPFPGRALVLPGFTLPELSIADVEGNVHRLEQLGKEKVTVLVYWSITCPHCRAEIPHLVNLNKRWAGNPFAMIFVNADGTANSPVIQNYAEQNQMPGPILMDEGPDDSLPLAYLLDVNATPTVFVFDKNGKLTFAEELEVDLTNLQKAVEEAF